MAQLAEANRSDLLDVTLQQVVSMHDNHETVGIYKDHLTAHVLPVISGIARSCPDEDTRCLALEVLISLAEAKPKMILKIPRAIEESLDVCVLLLLQLGDDVQEWAQQDDEDDEEKLPR